MPSRDYNRRRKAALHGRDTTLKMDRTNTFRVQSGLRVNETKARECLCCGNEFLSESYVNRLCYNCNVLSLSRY